ncbi:MAG: hypothetical protein ACR2MG_06915 [Pyrinomonadaceae bacterium]
MSCPTQPVAKGDEQPMFVGVRRLQRRTKSLSNTYGFGETPAP